MRRKERGITLIALVVTIIVLLILAGVALNATLGENGVIQRSKEAANTYRNAETDEQTEMNTAIDQWDKIVGSKKTEPSYIPEGYSHKEGTIETGYVITDSTAEDKEGGNEFVWIPVDGSSLTYDRRDWGNVTARNMSDCEETETSENAVVQAVIEQRRTFETSVVANGGFYIARYEAGIPEEMTVALGTATEDARNVEGVPVSKKNATPWNFIDWDTSTKNAAKFAQENNITGCGSMLITSGAWDTTLQWIINGNDRELDQASIQTDSTSWGNYYNAPVTGIKKYSVVDESSWPYKAGAEWSESDTGITKAVSSVYWLLPTGHSDYTKVNNIYDLAGNLFEWTTEYSTYSRVSRGGVYGLGGSVHPSSYRSNDPSTSASHGMGFRFVLYKS